MHVNVVNMMVLHHRHTSFLLVASTESTGVCEKTQTVKKPRAHPHVKSLSEGSIRIVAHSLGVMPGRIAADR